jgi:hypothetical protein
MLIVAAFLTLLRYPIQALPGNVERLSRMPSVNSFNYSLKNIISGGL